MKHPKGIAQGYVAHTDSKTPEVNTDAQFRIA